MENSFILVDCKKAAKQARSTGEFMMAKCDSGNLLISGQFVLSLTADQFFSVKCKLEIPEMGMWWMASKDKLVRSERQPDIEMWEGRYNEWLNETDPNGVLTNTQLSTQECAIYTDGNTYVAIKQERLAMMAYSENLRRSGRMIVVDGVHVLAPTKKDVWQKNEWLYRLPGFDAEKEAEEEK